MPIRLVRLSNWLDNVEPDFKELHSTALSRAESVARRIEYQHHLLRGEPAVVGLLGVADHARALGDGTTVTLRLPIAVVEEAPSPAVTPEDVVVKLHAAIGRTLQDPAVRSQLAAQTQVASAPMTLAESAKFFDAETARYRAIARQIKLQPQ